MTNNTDLPESGDNRLGDQNEGDGTGGGNGAGRTQTARFVVRDARREDCHAIHRMIIELAQFEKMEDQVEISVQQLEEDGFGTTHPPRYQALVAEEVATGQAVAYSMFVEKYSTWKGRFLWIEDIYVCEPYRKCGLGDAIFRKLTAKACRDNLARIEWVVLNYNEPALNFYQKLGAFDLTKAEAWHLYRFNEERFAQFMQRNDAKSNEYRDTIEIE